MNFQKKGIFQTSLNVFHIKQNKSGHKVNFCILVEVLPISKAHCYLYTKFSQNSEGLMLYSWKVSQTRPQHLYDREKKKSDSQDINLNKVR